MKTLPSNFTTNSEYLKTGNQPRFFVYVSTAERKWATEVITDYTNRIQKIQEINEEVEPFGGLRSMSAVNTDVLKIGEEMKFYSSASIYPRLQGSNVGAGRIYAANLASTYAATRGAISGTADGLSFSGMTVGQFANTGLAYYVVHRTFMQFDIPSALTSCEEAYLNLTGVEDVSSTDFYIYIVEGSWTATPYGAGINLGSFDEFSGWESGVTAYTGTILNDAFYTSTHMSATSTNRIRFNRAGRDAIVAAAATTNKILYLMMLSSRDYDASEPTGSEYVSFKVSLQSTPTLELIYNTVRPDNARARVYMAYKTASGTPSTVSSMLNLWSGVVDSWSLNESRLALSMRYDDFKRNVKLHANVIDSTTYAKCPTDNIGKSIPIVVGDFSNITHEYRLGSCLNETVTTNRYGNGDFVKGYIYNKSDATEAIFASHELKEGDFFWSEWNDSVNSFVMYAGDVSRASTGCYSITAGSAAVFPYRLVLDSTANTTVQPVQLFVPYHLQDFDQAGSTINGAYAVDASYTNWALLDRNNESAEYGAQYAQWGVANHQKDDVAFIVETSAASGYVSDAIKFTYYTYKDDGTALAQTDQYINTDGQHVYYYNNSNLSENYINMTIVMAAVKDISAKPCKFRNICVAQAYSNEIPNEVYMKCKGIADTTSATYTSAASSLIENPSDVIRWLVMSKGGYSSSEVDSNFTTARTALSGWKYAFQWSDETGIEDLFSFEGRKGLVDELAFQCNSIVWEEHTGKIKIKTFDIDATFPNSGTSVPGNLDRFEYSGSPSSGLLVRHPIYSFDIQQASMDKAYNSFVLKYAQNYATGAYDKVLYIDNGSGVAASVSHNITASYLATYTGFSTTALALTELKRLTAACYNDINTTNEYVFEAWAIRDDQTATRLLQRLVWWYTRRRFVITLTTGLNAVAFELGDMINIRTDDIEDQFGTAFMEKKKWMITHMSTDVTNCKITIEAIEADIY